jgi:hypothetical protein
MLLAAREQAALAVLRWQEVIRKLDVEINTEVQNRLESAIYNAYAGSIPDDVSESGQGDDLPRDREREQPVRYHRGTPASGERSLRQQRDPAGRSRG